jgi:hypothetical protein
LKAEGFIPFLASTVKKGKTPVLTPEEAHALLESIPITKKPANERRPISLISSGCATAL